jgi:hypothetical protein
MLILGQIVCSRPFPNTHIQRGTEVGRANIVLVIGEFYTRNWYSG